MNAQNLKVNIKRSEVVPLPQNLRVSVLDWLSDFSRGNPLGSLAGVGEVNNATSKTAARLVQAEDKEFVLQTRNVNWVFENEEMFSLSEVMEITHCKTRQAVHAAEKRNVYFGLMPPARSRGTQYPKWQFEPEVLGKPLSSVLQTLGAMSSLDKWLFFTSRSDRLEGLTPLVVLRGQLTDRNGKATAAQQELLASVPKLRLEVVLNAAEDNVLRINGQ